MQSKPKIRYFNIQIDDFALELCTSSFTNFAYRDKMTQSDMLGNIVYSKLPDVLQSSISHKYIILTVNPIVDLFDDCKNTLGLTLCKNVPQTPSNNKEEDWKDWKNSPLKEELNETTKKKLESFERENEQTILRMRKL